jgi:hypothetical protein
VKKPSTPRKLRGCARGAENFCGGTQELIFRNGAQYETGFFYLNEIKGHIE